MTPEQEKATLAFLNSDFGEENRVTHDLRQAVREYISECDNPVPDYSHRRTLRNRLRELAGCPPEPRPRIDR